MGLFSGFVSKPSGTSSAATFGGSQHLSIHDVKKQVRGDLHEKLGKMKGEEIYNMLSEDFDKDGALGTTGISGREVNDMLHKLQENHQDNIHDDDLNHIKDVLHKHFND